MLAIERWETTEGFLQASIIVAGLLMLLGLPAGWRVVSAFVTPSAARSSSKRPASAFRARLARILPFVVTVGLMVLAFPAGYRVYEDLSRPASLEEPLTTEGAPLVALYDIDRDGSPDMMSLAPSQQVADSGITDPRPALVPVPGPAGGNGVLIAAAVISAFGTALAAASPNLIETRSRRKDSARALEAERSPEPTEGEGPKGP